MKWELKKLIKVKLLWLFLAVFLFLNMYQIRQMDRLISAPLDGHDTLLEQIQGLITNEKIAYVTESLQEVTDAIASGQAQPGEYDPERVTGYAYGDQYEFQYFYDELFYCYSYEAEIDQILQRAREAKQLYEESGNQTEAERCRLILETYEGRALPYYDEMDQIERYLSYDGSALFVLLFLILSLPGLIFRDSSEGMAGVIAVSEKGKDAYFYTKSMAALVWAAGVALLFHLQDFWLFGLPSRFDALRQPLYAIESSWLGMFSGSAGVFCLLRFIGCLLFYWCAGQGILLLAYWVRRPMGTALLMIAAIGLLAFLAYREQSVFNPIGALALFAQQQTFSAVMLAGRAYPAYWVNLLCCGGYALALLLLFGISAKKRPKRR